MILSSSTARVLPLALLGSLGLLLTACTSNEPTDDDSVTQRTVSGVTVYEQSSTSYPTVTDVSAALNSSSASSAASDELSIIPTPISEASESSVTVTGTMSITQEPDKTEANTGERVWYTIVVSNKTNTIMTNLVVENTLPAGKMTVIDPSGGIVSGERITWTIESLEPGQSRLVRFQGEIAKTIGHGESIVNIVTLRGGKLPVTVTATSEVSVIQKLPQAGVGDYTKPLEDTSKYLRPYKN
jgi:uncharacterized repeat protein (TIGR01451 family)